MPAAGTPENRGVRAVLYGTLAVGVLDGLDAVIFHGLRGVPPDRVFQAVASGVLGRAAFYGGVESAVLGLAIHFVIAFCVVWACTLVVRRLPVLAEAPFTFGIVYGLGVYAFMNLVVVPLSAAGEPRFTAPVLVNGVLIHVLGVGIPSALAAAYPARAARRAASMAAASRSMPFASASGGAEANPRTSAFPREAPMK
jgi:hypothetical protein